MQSLPAVIRCEAMSLRVWLVLGIVSATSIGSIACTPQVKAASDVVIAPPVAPAPTPATASLVMTSEGLPFVQSSVRATSTTASEDLLVEPDRPMQSISGFGGAFNEHGWKALAALGVSEREAVLKSLFDPREGLRFNWGRMPIGASDYALDRYTLDEVRDDYEMKGFSIERDKQALIPYLQAALRFRPDLRLWASAWTPPTWMKTNGDFDGGAMRDEPKIYAAYALYLAKFIKSYAALGINVSMVVPQNEPGQLTRYPSCDWQPQQYVSFIADHLGPTFRNQHVNAKIFVGTINKADWNVLHVLESERVHSQIAGVALQWRGLEQAAQIRERFPRLEIMQSETECGNNHWQPGFNRDTPPNDFRYAAYTWRKIRDFVRAGSSSYMLWNMVLDEHGKNIDSEQPWPQNSAVVIDRAKKTVTYTPMYWATKHFSGLIDTGAHLVYSSGSYLDGLAFVNPDGTTVVELLNTKVVPVKILVKVRSVVFDVELKGLSIASLLVPNARG